MSAVTDKDRYLKQLDRFDQGRRTSPFQSLRQSARARLRDLPFPTLKTEDWRFTNVGALLKVPFQLPARASVDARILPELPTPNTIRLVFVNGALAPELSTRPAAAGVEIGNLAAIGPEQAKRLGEVVGSADDEGQVFTALNTSFLHDGAYVRLPENCALLDPIEIIYLSAPEGQTIVTYPRTVVDVGKGARVTMLERYIDYREKAQRGLQASEGQAYFTNAVTEIHVSENAAVDHYKLQDESRHAYHIATTQIVQAQSSRFSTHYISLGGALVRNEVRVRFDGAGSEATVNGLYFGRGDQHVDNFTVIDHAKPHCASHELYKGILSDRAHGVFNGKIFVRPDAQKTDAKQTNKVLLLSQDATINTKPQLEIFADDVKCTHGATVGQLDAESIFYLRSRGIGLEEAKALLTFAFAGDIVNRIQIETLRQWLEDLVIRTQTSEVS